MPKTGEQAIGPVKIRKYFLERIYLDSYETKPNCSAMTGLLLAFPQDKVFSILKNILIGVVLFFVHSAFATDFKAPFPGSYQVYTDNDLIIHYAPSDIKILPNHPLSNAKHCRLIKIAGARNETEQFQLVLYPKKKFSNVELRFSGFENSKCHFTWQRAVNVNIPRKTYIYTMKANQTGMIPDPLTPGKIFDPPVNTNTSLLITAHISTNASPGDYSGFIELWADGKCRVKLQVMLTVWNITIPTERRFQTRIHEGGKYPIIFHKDTELGRHLCSYGVTALKYGAYGLKIKFLKKQNKIVLNTQDYLKQCRFILNDLKIRYITLPPGFLIRKNKPVDNYLGTGIQVGSEEFWPVFKDYMTQMRQFYQKHGWENKILFGIGDEPKKDHFKLMTQIAREAKKHFPEIKVFMTLTKPIPDEFASVIDIACFNWSQNALLDDYFLTWQRYNKQYDMEVWSYQNGIFHINHQNNPTMLRLYPTVNVKYGSKGILWWRLTHSKAKSLDFWSHTPYQYKHKKKLKGTKKEHQYQYGGGQFLYPPRPGENFVHSSLRWEAYCQGLEDAELMLLLKDELVRGLKVFKNDKNPLFSPDYIISTWGSLLTDKFRCKHYRPDAGYIQRFRTLIAHEIMNINLPPAAIVSFDKQQLWNYDGKRIKVLIRCAENAKIKINNSQPSECVKGQTFSKTIHLNPGFNPIKIHFQTADGAEKTLHREIYVKPVLRAVK